MKGIIVLMIILISSLTLWSQTFNISLSPTHSQKLNKYKTGHKRMLKYYKFYRADSVKEVKARLKKSKKVWDSLLQVEKITAKIDNRLLSVKDKAKYIDSIQRNYKGLKILAEADTTREVRRKAIKQIKQISRNEVTLEIARGDLMNKEIPIQDSVKMQLAKWLAILKSPVEPDSIKSEAKKRVRELMLLQASSNPRLAAVLQHYKQNNQVPDWKILEQHIPGFDSISGLMDKTPADFMEDAEKTINRAVIQSGQLDGLGKDFVRMNDLKEQVTNLTNPDSLKSEGKAKLKAEAIDHFANQSEKLVGAQGKLGKILSKYRSFSNAEDLSSAVKRTSLAGKTFMERIAIGGNFNIISTKPVSIDASPTIAYKIKTTWNVGLGVNYRTTFGDSIIQYSSKISNTNSSLRVFSNLDVFRNFFLNAEYERTDFLKSAEEKSEGLRNNYFGGLGKKLLIHPKVFVVVTALYRFNDKSQFYANRFQMRIGFQSSDLAFRKKKIYYER